MKFIVSKKTVLISFLLLFTVLLLVIRITTSREDTRNQASAITRLYFTPDSTAVNPVYKKVNDSFTLKLMIDPGLAQASFVQFALIYDATKLTVNGQSSIIFNTTAFPVVFEGPYLNPGSINATVSIGSDPTKAVTTPVEVASITFKAIAKTQGPIQIRLNDPSMVLSIGANESASQNVLGLREPAYVSIDSDDDDDDEITPSITSSIGTKFSLTVFLHGLGNSGDNPNPNTSSLSNKNPLHKTRNINVELFNDINELTATKASTITYASGSGNFLGTVEFDSTIPPGDYVIKIKSDQYLRNAFPGIQKIPPETSIIMSPITLITGDVIDDNKLNILDYNVLYGCFKTDLFPVPRNCTEVQNLKADLNDEGQVNMYDINLFIRELSVQSGL